MVDLEQFREAVEQWKMLAQVGEVVEAMPVAFRKKPEEYTARIAEADRLLSIIDSAGEVEKEPSAVRSLVDAANAVLALYPGDDLLWTLESAVRPFNAAKPAECAKECPPQQVCDYCQIASTAKQPAAVVDEAAARRLDDYLSGEFDIRIGKQAAHAALTAALAAHDASISK